MLANAPKGDDVRRHLGSSFPELLVRDERLDNRFWEPIKAYWREPNSREKRDVLRNFLTYDATRWQCSHGIKTPELVSPDGPPHDQFLLDRPRNDEIQLDLFASGLEIYQRIIARFDPATLSWSDGSLQWKAMGSILSYGSNPLLYAAGSRTSARISCRCWSPGALMTRFSLPSVLSLSMRRTITKVTRSAWPWRTSRYNELKAAGYHNAYAKVLDKVSNGRSPKRFRYSWANRPRCQNP
jgi:hypothetical protein